MRAEVYTCCFLSCCSSASGPVPAGQGDCVYTWGAENSNTACSLCNTVRAIGPLATTAVLLCALLPSLGLAEVINAVHVSPSSTTKVLRWLALKLISARYVRNVTLPSPTGLGSQPASALLPNHWQQVRHSADQLGLESGRAVNFVSTTVMPAVRSWLR